MAIFLFAFAAMLIPIVVIGRWILGPIDRAAKARKAPVRISIGDFLCLFLAVQIPLTAVYQFVGKDEQTLFWLFTIITWVAAPVIWFACGRALSKAGVSNGRYRFIFLGLVVPVVYYGLMPFVVLTAVGIVTPLLGESVQFNRYFPWIVSWVMLAVALFLCGIFTRRMLRQVDGRAKLVERPSVSPPD